MCGGDPFLSVGKLVVMMVFSTYVEVILLSIGVGETVTGILHACGGDPLRD